MPEEQNAPHAEPQGLPEEEFSKLPPVVRRAVGSASNLREMCMLETSEVETVEQSHFVRNYAAMVKRTRDEAKIPSKVRELIAQAAQERLAEKPVNLLEEAKRRQKFSSESGNIKRK